VDAAGDNEWGWLRDGCIRWVAIVEGEGADFGLNLGRPIVTNGDFATTLFPNYFGQYLLLLTLLFSESQDQAEILEWRGREAVKLTVSRPARRMYMYTK